ncbi:protein TIFY 10b [Magnolia sinica]|uniref:protein TIFY 10b n=1 Tax=Magnolia sinica TaxID=86752 RepID=UPI0026587FB5|nr:protein TIFY 10b [Magnolia sinica]
MSASTDFSETGRFSGRKSPEKSNFKQTCSLLSQYMKEKGSIGDLSLGMSCNLEGKGNPETLRPATMNLLPGMEMSGEVSDRNAMDLFPQHAGFGPSVTTEDARKISHTRPSNVPETAQMTIFYGGKVLVFNDFPADKAREVMLMASKGTVPNPSAASTPGIELGNRPQQHNTSFASASATSNGSLQDRLPRPPQANTSDLPIARKVSLHRFLEKRKERISAKAPYQMSKPSATPVKPTENKPWLGLAPQPS